MRELHAFSYEKAAKVFILIFLCGLLIIALSLFFLQRTPLDDVFQSGETLQRGNLADLPTSNIQAAKIAHALNSEKLALGLFGNSRAVAVSKDDLGLTEQEFFNFSVPGTSLRSTVLMIEYLAQHDALPETVLISMDNFRLEYFGPAEFPVTLPRWNATFADLIQGMDNPDISKAEVLRASWRNIWQEWQTFTLAMNAALVKRLLFGLPDGTLPFYNLDGSRPEGLKPTSVTSQFDPLPEQPPQVLPGYLQRDLQRLATIQRNHNVAILIYESPLHFSAGPSPSKAEYLRQLFLETCQKNNLICAPATAINTFQDSDIWQDVSHPPARQLGVFIARFAQGSPSFQKGIEG
ncbi:MAG: hypothetical protein P1V34_08170 [Alphaproteobacteria bacterium]|nr:hypothetical protein [Alphaproteobacteria bacterium]